MLNQKPHLEPNQTKMNENTLNNTNYVTIRVNSCPICKAELFIVEGRCRTCKSCGWSICC